MSHVPQLCLVEDDPVMGESLCDRFLLEGFGCECFTGAGPALTAITTGRFDVVIADSRLPDMSGEDLFKLLRERARVVPPFVVITGYGSIPRAVELLKCGAVDYIVKPFDVEQLVHRLRELTATALAEDAAGANGELLGVSPAMTRIEALLRRLAQHREAVVLSGESGWARSRSRRCCIGFRRAAGRGCPSWRSTAARSRRACWRRSCSATSAARSPAP